jgi:hypothetical protein
MKRATDSHPECRRELCFPIADRLVAEHQTADQEHLGQTPQAELVVQPPEHHESDDVTRILRSVQQAGAALVELRPTPAAKAAVALCRAFRSLPHGC